LIAWTLGILPRRDINGHISLIEPDIVYSEFDKALIQVKPSVFEQNVEVCELEERFLPVPLPDEEDASVPLPLSPPVKQALVRRVEAQDESVAWIVWSVVFSLFLSFFFFLFFFFSDTLYNFLNSYTGGGGAGAKVCRILVARIRSVRTYMRRIPVRRIRGLRMKRSVLGYTPEDFKQYLNSFNFRVTYWDDTNVVDRASLLVLEDQRFFCDQMVILLDGTLSEKLQANMAVCSLLSQYDASAYRLRAWLNAQNTRASVALTRQQRPEPTVSSGVSSSDASLPVDPSISAEVATDGVFATSVAIDGDTSVSEASGQDPQRVLPDLERISLVEMLAFDRLTFFEGVEILSDKEKKFCVLSSAMQTIGTLYFTDFMQSYADIVYPFVKEAFVIHEQYLLKKAQENTPYKAWYSNELLWLAVIGGPIAAGAAVKAGRYTAGFLKYTHERMRERNHMRVRGDFKSLVEMLERKEREYMDFFLVHGDPVEEAALRAANAAARGASGGPEAPSGTDAGGVASGAGAGVAPSLLVFNKPEAVVEEVSQSGQYYERDIALYVEQSSAVTDSLGEDIYSYDEVMRDLQHTVLSGIELPSDLDTVPPAILNSMDENHEDYVGPEGDVLEAYRMEEESSTPFTFMGMRREGEPLEVFASTTSDGQSPVKHLLQVGGKADLLLRRMPRRISSLVPGVSVAFGPVATAAAAAVRDELAVKRRSFNKAPILLPASGPGGVNPLSSVGKKLKQKMLH